MTSIDEIALLAQKVKIPDFLGQMLDQPVHGSALTFQVNVVNVLKEIFIKQEKWAAAATCRDFIRERRTDG